MLRLAGTLKNPSKSPRGPHPSLGTTDLSIQFDFCVRFYGEVVTTFYYSSTEVYYPYVEFVPPTFPYSHPGIDEHV